jgi:3-methyladenine DNA glycosylase AlkD
MAGADRGVDVKAIARSIDAALRAIGDAERAVQEKRYLKSELVHLGTGMPALRKVIKEVRRQHRDLPRSAVIALVEILWDEPAAAPIHERRAAAVELLDLHKTLLEPRDLGLIERLVRESKTWALVDALAVAVAGSIVDRFPSETRRDVDRWARDDDFWVRRAAMLSLLRPLREGRGDFERFGRYADAMLEEKEFFIRKAIGWILRETSKKRPELVRAWIEPRRSRASGLTVREATKYLGERR